ncbi:MAG: hypothetical protein K1X78_01340 [Verrucomicrobiaceae bacterium]|nr:hypothetical protein [Verrucomicrobiaceae bacterium]
MPEQAKVTSLDVLESFRARLIVFLSKSRRGIDEVTDEIRRTRNWLEGEGRVRWEAEVKKSRKRLEQAEAELMSARFSEFIDTPSVQQMQVRKARRALEDAERKLAAVKRWSRDFDSRADPLAKKLESLRHHFDHVMPQGVTWLVQAQRTLEGYTETPWEQMTDAAAASQGAPASTPAAPSAEPEVKP